MDGEVLVDPWAMRCAASFRPWLAGVNRRRMVEDYSINILSMRRQMILDLRPSLFGRACLETALKSLIDQFFRTSNAGRIT